MREITTSGIVLGYEVCNEYDRTVDFFTNSFGKIRATAKFAQKPTSPFVGRLDLMNICKLHLYKSTKGKFTLKQCVLNQVFENAKKDILCFSLAMSVLEIAGKLTYTHHGMKKHFDLIAKTLRMLEKNIKPYLIYLIFKIKFLNLLGLIPSFKHCMTCHKKMEINDITVWGAENVICANCMEKNKNKITGNIFDAQMLKFINFILDNEYEKSLKIKASEEDVKNIEIFMDEVWGKHNLPSLNSEKVIKQIF